MKLQFFPSQELNQIRREVKQFKEQQEQMLSSAQLVSDQEDVAVGKTGKKNPAMNSSSGDTSQGIRDGYDNLVSILQEETQLCEKKLDILSHRRQSEEEARLLLLRKLARMRSIEDQQSKDPTNFRNQSGRF